MALNHLVELASYDTYFKTMCFFLDKNQNLQIAYIREYPEESIKIKVYNENGDLACHLDAYFSETNKIYLSHIYVHNSYRSLNIGKTTSFLLEYLLKDYPNIVIWGVRSPYDNSNSELSQKELNKRADAFYKSAGYKLITYNKFVKRPKRYSEVQMENFWQFEPIPDCLIAKTLVRQNLPFQELDGWIFHENALEKVEELELAIYMGSSFRKEFNIN